MPALCLLSSPPRWPLLCLCSPDCEVLWLVTLCMFVPRWLRVTDTSQSVNGMLEIIKSKVYIVTPNLEVWAMFVRMYELRVVWACDGKHGARQTNWRAQSPPKCCCCLPPCLSLCCSVGRWGLGGGGGVQKWQQKAMLLKWSRAVAQECDVRACNMCSTFKRFELSLRQHPPHYGMHHWWGKKSWNQIKMQDETGRFEMTSPKDV